MASTFSILLEIMIIPFHVLVFTWSFEFLPSSPLAFLFVLPVFDLFCFWLQIVVSFDCCFSCTCCSTSAPTANYTCYGACVLGLEMHKLHFIMM